MQVKQNKNSSRARAETLRALTATVREGGGEAARARHIARGKLPARERVEKLLDRGSPFLEIGMLAAHEVYDTPLPAAGIVAGVGWVAGRACIICANDATVKGGSYYPLAVKKHLRAQEIAMNNRLPCLYLVDSGGAYLRGQAEVFPDRDHFGRIFYNQAKMSAAGIAQIAVVMGPCTAGGAYIPAMADVAVIVNKTGAIYLAGPPLVKAATGEVTDSETLGGAKTHTQKSGLADYFAEDDEHALRLARRIVGNLGADVPAAPPPKKELPPAEKNGEEMYGILDEKNINMHSVLQCISDKNSIDEFKRDYGKTLITAFARIGGAPAAVLANNGVLFSESAQKGAHFIDLASRRNIPLLFLQNTTGFMVGAQYEAEGIAKHGAKMVNAVSNSAVAKVTILVGGSFGAGNYAMCGRAYDPDFLFTLPTSQIAVMGGEQAANVMADIAAGKKKISKAEREKIRRPVLQQFARESDPYYATARLWDDGIIDPAQLREVLIVAFAACAGRQQKTTRFGVFRM